MRIGLEVPSFTWPGGEREIAPRLAEIAHTVDQGGFYSLWVMDHFFQMSIDDFLVQSFIANFVNEGFDGTVLPGTTRFNQ